MIFFVLAALGVAWILFSTRGGVVKIADYARKAGFSGNDLVLAVAIAMAESSGKIDAVGDKDLAPERGPSLGLWQINMGTKVHGTEFGSLDMFDPQTNANAAYTLYSRAGKSFRDWSTFTQINPKTKEPYYAAHLDAADLEVNA